ncbi:MAG: type II toxin-antitoxin system toxin DNA ADP-ribosyl transferase DarT [Waterburya sp.]
MSTPIYHITHISNLASILNSGGLIACNVLRQQQANYTDIAYQTIQDTRAVKQVPCGAGGVLHDYVPFYFAPRSPMLCAIHGGYVQGYQDGQDLIIHLVVEIEAIANLNLAFAYTDGHAIMAFSEFYDDLKDLSQIDWQIMGEKYWRDTDEDNDRKRRRQAEFLIHQFCPWTLVKEVGVINNNIKIKVEKILQNYKYQPSVKIYPQWYY